MTDAKITKAFQGMLTQKETNYVPLSATAGKACANCRWFLPYGGCFIVDSYPEPILPTGLSDRWEATPAPEPNLTETIAEAVTEAAITISEALPVQLSHDHEAPGEVIIDPVAPILTQLKNRIRRQPLKDGTHVLKDNAGRRYMYMVTSNGYRDQDNAHVTTKAIEDYADHCWTDDGKFIGDNSHFIWHTKELGSVSDLVFADVWSGFLVEVWREKEGYPIAKAFYNYVEKHPEIEWGASQGFLASKQDIKAGLYKSIAKYESSSLPRAAASNVYTLSEVLPMVEKGKRDTFLNKLFEEEFGIKDAAQLLKEGPEKLRAELADKGVVAKALGDGSEAVLKVRGEAMKQNAELILSMVEVQDQLDRDLTDLKTAQTKELATRDGKLTLLENQLADQKKAHEKDLSELRVLVNATPRRAAHDDSTVVKESEKDVLKDNLPAADPVGSWLGLPMKPKTVP